MTKDEMRTLKITSNLLLVYGIFIFLYAILYFFINLYAVIWGSFWLYEYFFFLGLLVHVGFTLILVFGSFMLIHARKLLQEHNILGCTGGIFGLLIVVLPMLYSFPTIFDLLDDLGYLGKFLGFLFPVWIFFNFITFYLLFSVKAPLKSEKRKNPT